MKAIVIQEDRTAAVKDVQKPSLRARYIRIKVVAVAINPTDGGHLRSAGPVGGILGCDVAGVVDAVGESCTATPVKPGDRVCGLSHGGNMSNPEDGGFAEYAMLHDGLLFKIPQQMSFEEVVSMPVGVLSAGMALYTYLKLPTPEAPTNEPYPILINGGSSASGSILIQFARLSGLKAIATASPKNFDFVKSRGADVVYDYADRKAGATINAETENKLLYAVDCISNESSFPLSADALSDDSSLLDQVQFIGLLPVDAFPRKDVKAQDIIAYTASGEAFEKFGRHFPVNVPHWEAGVQQFKRTETLLAAGKLVPHPADVRSGGLQGVIDGIKEMQSGKVSARKLVYCID